MLPCSRLAFGVGGCGGRVGGQSGTMVCFSIGIPDEEPAGFHSLFFQAVHGDCPSHRVRCTDSVLANSYELGVCVKGYNSWFQGIGNTRYPTWGCVTRAGMPQEVIHQGTSLANT